MTESHLDDLKDCALAQFRVASLRGVANPLGIAVAMRDGSTHSWNNVASDFVEGDEFLAEPLQALLEQNNATCPEDLNRAQEIDHIVLCGTFNTRGNPASQVSGNLKDAFANYIGTPTLQRVYMLDYETGKITSFSLTL